MVGVIHSLPYNKMNRRYYYLPFIIALVLVFILGRSCSNSVIPNHSEVDKLKQANKILEVQNEILMAKALIQADTAFKWKDRWHKAKSIHDTIPCEEKLPIVINTCDSAIIAFERLNETKDSIISNDNTIIGNLKAVAKIDSVTIDSLTHSKKKYWKGFKLGLAVGFGGGVVVSGLVK
jgi:hypothetical protein